MAFVNEKLTLEQQKKVNSWKIKYPIIALGQIIGEEILSDPWYWTVDKERNIYLLATSFDRHYPDEHIFVFIWNNNQYLVQFSMWFEDDNVVIWDFPKKQLIKTSFPYCKEKYFIDDLREALLAYKWLGEPSALNEKIISKCNF